MKTKAAWEVQEAAMSKTTQNNLNLASSESLSQALKVAPLLGEFPPCASPWPACLELSTNLTSEEGMFKGLLFLCLKVEFQNSRDIWGRKRRQEKKTKSRMGKGPFLYQNQLSIYKHLQKLRTFLVCVLNRINYLI